MFMKNGLISSITPPEGEFSTTMNFSLRSGVIGQADFPGFITQKKLPRENTVT